MITTVGFPHASRYMCGYFCLGLHGFAVSNLAGVMLYSTMLEITVWTHCFVQSQKPHGKGYFRYFRILRLVSCCTVLLTDISLKRAEVFSGWHLLRNPLCATKHGIKSSSRWHTWRAPKHKQRSKVVPTKVSVPLPVKNKCVTVSNGGHFGLVEIDDMAWRCGTYTIQHINKLVILIWFSTLKSSNGYYNSFEDYIILALGTCSSTTFITWHPLLIGPIREPPRPRNLRKRKCRFGEIKNQAMEKCYFQMNMCWMFTRQWRPPQRIVCVF